MKSKQKMNLMVYPFRSKGKDGFAPIYIKVIIDGSDSKNLSIGEQVNLGSWNEKLKLDEDQCDRARKVNTAIAIAVTSLEDNMTSLKLNYEHITALMIKNAYLGKEVLSTPQTIKKESEKKHTLLEVTDDFIKEQEELVKKGKLSESTKSQWISIRAKFCEFIKFYCVEEDVALTAIDKVFVNAYVDFLTIKREMVLSDITAKRQVTNLKRMVERAVDKGWLDYNKISQFTMVAKRKIVKPLSYSEVTMLSEKKITLERLQQVRDIFIFQCYTGFAFIDLLQLTYNEIVVHGVNNKKMLVKDRQKTKVEEIVPLLPMAEKIIDKYRENAYCKKTQLLLPVNSNQKYNAYLKELAEICGIKRNLTTHLARHTFADIMLNVYNLPLEDVSRMLGHASIKSTQHYCTVGASRLLNNMEIAKGVLRNNGENEHFNLAS